MIANEGDFFMIPGASIYGLAKVIFCSEYFKNVILIKLSKKPYQCSEIKDLPVVDQDFLIYYTGADSIDRGLWVKVGFAVVTNEEKFLTKRIVGGDVWIGDQYVGPASDDDIVNFPKMLTYGFRLIEKAVSKLN